MASPIKHLQAKQPLKFEAVMLFWRIITQIFFREIRPRGAFHIPRDDPVIFVGAPHHNQVRRISAFLSTEPKSASSVPRSTTVVPRSIPRDAQTSPVFDCREKHGEKMGWLFLSPHG